MSTQRISALRAMLERGQDSALLRYSLGNEYFRAGDFEAAVSHLRAAIEQDRDYSAAWKLLGRSLSELQQSSAAIEVYREGIDIAEKNGDRQAAKEMTVFLKRLQKAQGN